MTTYERNTLHMRARCITRSRETGSLRSHVRSTSRMHRAHVLCCSWGATVSSKGASTTMSSPALINLVDTRPRPLPAICCTSHMVAKQEQALAAYASTPAPMYVTLPQQDAKVNPRRLSTLTGQPRTAAAPVVLEQRPTHVQPMKGVLECTCSPSELVSREAGLLRRQHIQPQAHSPR